MSSFTSANVTPLDAKVISSSTRVHSSDPTDAADSSSVFSYDLKHDTNSTLPEDTDFAPVESNVPVDIERRLTQTNHKEDATAAIASGPGVARAPTDDASVPAHEALAKRRDSVLAATVGGADAVSSGPGSEPRRKPSRKPTGSYGLDDSTKSLSSDSQSGGTGLFFSGGLPDTTSSGK